MVDSAASRMIVPPSTLPASLALRGPGRLGAEGPTGVMIFDAGETCRSHDMMARFFGEEINGLHWLEDYLLDPDMLHIFSKLEEAQREVDDEEDILYDKKALVDVDSNWGDTS